MRGAKNSSPSRVPHRHVQRVTIRFGNGSATGCDVAVHGHGVAIDERLVVEDRGRWGTQSYALVGLRAADLQEPLLVTYRLPGPMRTAVGRL